MKSLISDSQIQVSLSLSVCSSIRLPASLSKAEEEGAGGFSSRGMRLFLRFRHFEIRSAKRRHVTDKSAFKGLGWV